MSVGLAYHWRHRDPCAIDDLARVIAGDGETLAALATGYDSGFSTGWAAGSRVVLDLVVEAWRRDPAAAFATARAGYDARARPLVPPDDDFGDAPAASLLIARVLDGRIELEWLGDSVAWVIRDGAVLARTRRHTVAEEHGHRFPGADLSKIGGVLTRVIAQHLAAEPDTLTVATRPGDRLILASAHVVDALPDATIARLAAEIAAPGALADRLVTDTVVATDPWNAYVAVVDPAG